MCVCIYPHSRHFLASFLLAFQDYCLGITSCLKHSLYKLSQFPYCWKYVSFIRNSLPARVTTLGEQLSHWKHYPTIFYFPFITAEKLAVSQLSSEGNLFFPLARFSLWCVFFLFTSNLLECLNLWTTVFHQFWEILFKYCLCPVLSPILLELQLHIC